MAKTSAPNIFFIKINLKYKNFKSFYQSGSTSKKSHQALYTMSSSLGIQFCFMRLRTNKNLGDVGIKMARVSTRTQVPCECAI